jgi:hypothetical protein
MIAILRFSPWLRCATEHADSPISLNNVNGRIEIMNEHEQVHRDPTLSATRDHVVGFDSRMPRISWGAIFAGVVVMLGLSWLLHLLGISIGVSIADASDTVAMSDGLQGGAAVWLVLSWLISFFVGSLVAARLAGSLDDFSGMLHGMTLWGLGTIVAVVLGYMGISSLLHTGGQVVSTTAQGVGQVVSGVGGAAYSGASAAATGISQLANTQVVDTIQNQLSDAAIEAAAEFEDQLSEQEIRQVVNNLDERTLRRLTQDLINNVQEGAAELLASSTELSQQDAQSLINTTYRELEEQLGNPDNQQSLAQDLKAQMARQVDGYIAELDAQGGPQVTALDVRTAIDQLDAETMNTIAMRLVSGDERGAKRALANNTNLTSEQIDDIYEGASQGVSETVENFTAEANQVVEAASTYAQQVLWITFAGSALALAVSLAGGWLGADAARRAYAEVQHTHTV